MLIPVIPEAYDATGERSAMLVGKTARRFGTTYPFGRYVSQPLGITCSSLADVRSFLAGCEYVSDQDQFGRADYWMPPEEFETRRRGDCDDFALWTWRQLMTLGYHTRFVIGEAGRYGEGHAWVTIADGDRHFVVEPQLAAIDAVLPRVSGVRYKPTFSVQYEEGRTWYFQHKNPTFRPSPQDSVVLAAEWAVFWSRFWVRTGHRLGRRITKWRQGHGPVA